MATKKGRRERGSGSVYEVQEGGYIAALKINGKLVKRRAPDKPAAKQKLAELLALRDQQIDVHSGRQTIEDWLNVWYNQVAQQKGLKPRTLEHYREQMKRYILPHLGQHTLFGLNAHHIQEWVIKLRKEIQQRSAEMNRNHEGSRTVKAAAAVLRQALKLAVARRLIPFNPMAEDAVMLPAHTPEPGRPLSDQELGKLLYAAQSHRFAGLWFCYALLGIRRGEGLGLEWVSLDKENLILTIRQQVHLEGGQVVKADTKTKSGIRKLPVTRFLVNLISAQWDQQQRWRQKYGADYKEHGLIFCSRYGTPLWPRNESQSFRDMRDAAGLPDNISLHDLRHTVSTLLDECGASEALKAGILGHSKEKTATQIYTHARLKAMRMVLERVEERVLAAWDIEAKKHVEGDSRTWE